MPGVPGAASASTWPGCVSFRVVGAVGAGQLGTGSARSRFRQARKASFPVETGKWVWAHLVPFANDIALGVCLLEIGGPLGCGVAQGFAYALRVQERIERYGSAGSMRSNTADFLITLMAASSGA